MTITIVLSPVLAERVGGRPLVHVDGETVGQALRDLTHRFPELAPLVWAAGDSLGGAIEVFLHEHPIWELGGLDATLLPGDELSLVAVIEGARFS